MDEALIEDGIEPNFTPVDTAFELGLWALAEHFYDLENNE